LRLNQSLKRQIIFRQMEELAKIMYSLCNCEFKTLVSVFMMKENLFMELGKWQILFAKPFWKWWNNL